MPRAWYRLEADPDDTWGMDSRETMEETMRPEIITLQAIRTAVMLYEDGDLTFESFVVKIKHALENANALVALAGQP